jgi:circadian clock protein KaiC
VTHEEEVAELASVDAIIELNMTRAGADLRRTIEVRKLRGSSFRSGRHAMTITSEGVTVYPRLATVLPPEEPGLTGRRMGFGLPELDAMTRGGVPEYSVTLISGPSGSGKTTFGLHWLLDGVRSGDRGVLVSFRESVADLDAKTRGIGMAGFAERVERGEIQVMRVPPTEIDPEIVAHGLTQILSGDPQIKRVVLDGVVELELATQNGGWQHDYLGAIAEYLWRSRTTLLLLRESADRGLSVAQNRIELRRVAYQGELHRIVGIVSMQASDHDTTLREFRIRQDGVYILRENESADGVLRGIAAEHPFDER